MRLDLAAPQLDADGEVVVGRINFDAYRRARGKCRGARSSPRSYWISTSLRRMDFARDALALLEHEQHAVIGLGRAEAVNAGDGGDDDDVAALEERARGAHAQLVELVVDRGFLFDVGVARGHVGFRLVVIVIADEIFDGVLREEGLEFVVELRGERLIVREDDRGAIDCSMTFAIVKVLPEPVTPRRTWWRSPSLTARTSCAMASGWSPRGS